MSAVQAIDQATFEQEVLSSSLPVLIDFWAPWCGPCRMLGPVVDEIAREREDIAVGKVNVDEEMQLARRFRVMSIPTLVLFKDGEEMERKQGAWPKEEILAMLD